MVLLAEYGFNEGSGLSSADSSGNGRTLTASNTSTSWDASGRTGAGARTMHSGAMGANTALSAYTFMYWTKRTTTWTQWAASFGATSWYVEHDAANNYVTNWFDGTASLAGGATTALPLDEWVHIAGTLSGGTRTLYFNGASKGSGATGTRNFSTSHGVATTAAFSGDNSSYAGVVDEFRLYDTALTAAEIWALATTRIPNTGESLSSQAMRAMGASIF